MEKSIEDIWTKGFTGSKELVTPKISNLYNQKSKLLLEKIKKTYRADNNSILPLALLFGIGFSIYGKYLLVIYGVFLLISLYFFNRNLLKSLENVQVTNNTYEYLTSYRKKVNEIMATTTRLLGFLFPLAIIPAVWLFFRDTDVYMTLINKVTTLKLGLVISGIALLFSILSISVYKITTKILYGNYLNKLDAIIDDLEDLNN